MPKNKFNIRKAVQALNFFARCENCNCINKMKAYKLLWLADRYHVRQYGRMITNDIYHALPKGNVPSTVMSLLDGEKKDFYFCSYISFKEEQYNYKSEDETDINVFSDTDIEVLTLIAKTFGKMSASELSQYSHLFPEWKRFEDRLNDASQKNSYKIRENDFFENVVEDSKLFNDDNELLELTKKIFSSN